MVIHLWRRLYDWNLKEKSSGWYLRALFGFKIKRGGVYAVAQASFVARAIFKEVTQVGVTPGTNYLDATHTVTVVIAQLDVALADHIPETGPARSGMEFGVR